MVQRTNPSLAPATGDAGDRPSAPRLTEFARLELRGATLLLRDTIAALNATDDDDDDDGHAYEARRAAEKAFVAVSREYGVTGTTLDGVLYAGTGADVARVEVLQDTYALDLARVVTLDD